MPFNGKLLVVNAMAAATTSSRSGHYQGLHKEMANLPSGLMLPSSR